MFCTKHRLPDRLGTVVSTSNQREVEKSLYFDPTQKLTVYEKLQWLTRGAMFDWVKSRNVFCFISSFRLVI